MKLWISSEADIDVADLYRETRVYVEKEFNSRLDEVKFNSVYEKWAVILMIRENKNWADEIAKRHIKRKALEFRLKIDHDDFLNGDFNVRANMFLDSLHISVDKMERLGVSLEDRDKLHGLLNSVRNDL